MRGLSSATMFFWGNIPRRGFPITLTLLCKLTYNIYSFHTEIFIPILLVNLSLLW